ncbi:MAG: Arc/MetJ family transcription regulator [Paracoccaceae bacterium]|jgi:Arc/MetJ family transcription regulator
MRTTVTIDDTLLEKARSYAGVEKVSELIDLTLKNYVAREASSRLAALGGSDPFAEFASRRKIAEEPGPTYRGMLAEPKMDFNAKDPES